MKRPARAVMVMLFATLAVSACEREARRIKQPAASSLPAQARTGAQLEAGGVSTPKAVSNAYEENAYAMSQGKRLYTWFNCVGCHANGGGGSGPALMDDKWLYGHEPANIYTSIVEGRPNGMPSFGGKIQEDQVWQLVAYVRSMSGLAHPYASPSRNDDMQTTGPEASRDPPQPKSSGAPQPR
jgi:cytochrome c oxidase cbb3-type subunit 3